MANNIYHNPNYNFPQPQNGHGRANYLLGMGPVPPPRPQDVAVAVANHMLDHQAAGLDNDDDDEDENIDPQLRGPQPMQNLAARRVVIRIPVNDKVTRDIEFPTDILYDDFFNRIAAAMNLDPATAQLGWKTSDEGKRAAAHELQEYSDLDNAFKTILKIQDNPRRKREIVMEIVHLNPAPAPAPKKKTDGNRTTDFAYSAELRIVKEKLRCAQHTGPNRWCYVSPENPTEHVPLGYEEITLWARKIHDNDADADCVVPPNCLALENLRQKASRVRQVNSKSNVPPIHVHINNNPLGNTSRHNFSGAPGPRGMKRLHSTTSDDFSDSDEESLPLADVLETLNQKYPQLDLPQYMPRLEQEKIVYAETVLEFDKDYLVGLGIPEGAARPLLKGVEKVIGRVRKERKCPRISQKEQSVEI